MVFFSGKGGEIDQNGVGPLQLQLHIQIHHHWGHGELCWWKLSQVFVFSIDTFLLQGVGKSCLLHQFTEKKCKNLKRSHLLYMMMIVASCQEGWSGTCCFLAHIIWSLNFLPVMADCPHTIGVEFGTRIIEVRTSNPTNIEADVQAIWPPAFIHSFAT